MAIVDDFAKDRDPIDPPGVKSENLLASAAFRPQTTLGGVRKYPSMAMAAAALFHAIVLNHAFHNGNKRTALVSLISFLDRNGWVLMADEDELFEYVLNVAKHEVTTDYRREDPESADREMLAIARWLQQHVRRVNKAEYNIPFRGLRKILTEFDCVFDVRPGNRMDITREGLKTQIAYSGEGMEVPQNAVHKVRKDLELDEAHGYDAEAFYRSRARISGFIQKYRKILERLAEYDRLQAAAEP
jgi:death-on-curing protein